MVDVWLTSLGGLPFSEGKWLRSGWVCGGGLRGQEGGKSVVWM